MTHSHQRIALSVRLEVTITPLSTVKIDFCMTRIKD